ncbi:two-component system sensor histidine kinase NtrB [Pelagibacterium lacus]|uniref:histidine kinase n=1 Tax=Pelagibacterium lacus TaxID=2282655 RepID=A0A369W275_9HYPH|nr:ATP-binding protein [Pelagibacterium lacus]RDE08648.1 two-component sensor histidine kinase [Pelagibacterium lacus]
METDLHLSVLQSLPQPVLVCGRNNAIVFANYAAETFFYASSNLLTRQALPDIIVFGSPILSLVERVVERNASMIEYRVTVGSSRSNEERVADVHASPIPEMPGHVTLIFQERTMTEKIDRQLVSRGAARSVTGLAAMLAHEIKNPLSGIRGAAQLLEQASTGDDRALARLIRDETDRIVDLVDRMEVFGDERPVDRVPINIHVVLERVKMLAANGVAREVAFSEDYDPSLPPVLGDRNQLIQVFLNLIKNAAEAVEPTTRPEIRIMTAFRPGMRISVAGVAQRISLPLEIVIEDNGPGVPAELMPFLFDPFVTTKLSGSGLGLALVAKIVGDHGGVIDCESRPGRTRFKVLLPVAEGRDAAGH